MKEDIKLYNEMRQSFAMDEGSIEEIADMLTVDILSNSGQKGVFLKIECPFTKLSIVDCEYELSEFSTNMHEVEEDIELLKITTAAHMSTTHHEMEEI